MDEIGIQGVSVTPLKQIFKQGGSIFHALKKSESSFQGFGEAYFSHVDHNAIKAWKTHRDMLLNLVVPCGAVKFVMIDRREGSESQGNFYEITLGPDENYARLSIPPGITFGFMGVGQDVNLVLNVASIEHDPNEMVNIDKEEIPYNW